MKKIFFDTELTDLVQYPKLISIGLIDDTGQHTFYTELSDGWKLGDCGEFTLEHVLPLLDGESAQLPRRELRHKLQYWFRSFGEPVQLVTDSAAWDWPEILGIFKTPKMWPENLMQKPCILMPDSIEEELERAFDTGLRRHHALDDAKANRLAYIAHQEHMSARRPTRSRPTA